MFTGPAGQVGELGENGEIGSTGEKGDRVSNLFIFTPSKLQRFSAKLIIARYYLFINLVKNNRRLLLKMK